jgi:hypothetical protein
MSEFLPPPGPWSLLFVLSVGLLWLGLDLSDQRKKKAAHRALLARLTEATESVGAMRSELDTLRAKLAATEEERDTLRSVANGKQTCAWLDGLMGKGGLS